MKSKEIARILGISEATVSLVRNNRPGVSEETRRKVLKLLLPSQPVLTEPSPPQTRRKLSCLCVYRSKQQEIIQAQPAPIFHAYMSTFSQSAQALGYDLRISYAYPEIQSFSDLLRVSEEEGDAGIFLNDVLGDHPDYSPFRNAIVPVIVFDQDTLAQGLDCVVIDNRGAAEMLTTQLLDQGRSRILYIESSEDCYNLVERRRGFAETMAEHGIAGDSFRYLRFRLGVDDIKQLASDVSEFRPAAMIAEGSGQLMPALDSARLAGMEAGVDVAISCCDSVYNTVRPGLVIPSVDYGYHQQMEAAMMLMNSRLRGLRGPAVKMTVQARILTEHMSNEIQANGDL